MASQPWRRLLFLVTKSSYWLLGPALFKIELELLKDYKRPMKTSPLLVNRNGYAGNSVFKYNRVVRSMTHHDEVNNPKL